MLYFDDLSSCPESDRYYQKVLLNSEATRYTIPLRIVVDRGITNFVLLGKILIEKFPYLRELELHQEYSFCDGKTPEVIKHEFISFLKMMNLNSFTFYDTQSEFMHLVSVNELFSVMKKGASYDINMGDTDVGISEVYKNEDMTKILTITKEMGG